MKLFHYRTTPLFIVLWLICVGLLQREVTSQSFLAKDALIDINDGALIMRQDCLDSGQQKGGIFPFCAERGQQRFDLVLSKHFSFNPTCSSRSKPGHAGDRACGRRKSTRI